MKTKEDFTELNYDEYAFFKGISTNEAKVVFANNLFPKNWASKEVAENPVLRDKYLTPSGSPKIGKKDVVPVSSLDFTMRSNSALDGKSQLDYLCDYYNKGLSKQKLREHSENPIFVKALSFTGKNSVINDILNPDQLTNLKKRWLLQNCVNIQYFTDKAIEFIVENDWAKSFLIKNRVSEELIIKNIRKDYSRNKIKTYRHAVTN